LTLLGWAARIRSREVHEDCANVEALMPAIDIRSLFRLALVGIVAVRIDPRLGLLLITCFVVRRLTAGSETFVAKVGGPLATTWVIALSILLAIDGAVSVWLALTSNPEDPLEALSALESTIQTLSSNLHLLRLNWGANTAVLVALMIVAIYLPQWRPVTRFTATIKMIGRVSGVVGALASFTFFGTVTTLPKHVEAIVDNSARKERAKVQATLSTSAQRELDTWQRSSAVSVVKQALEESTTAPRLIEWAGEIGKVPSKSRKFVAELLVDTRVPAMTSAEEREINDLLTKRLRSVPAPWEKQLDVLERGGLSHGDHPWLETYDRARQRLVMDRLTPLGPATLTSNDPPARVREQMVREADAASAAKELEDGFRAVIAKTVDVPRNPLVDLGFDAVMTALAAGTSPFAEEIAKAVTQNIGREAVSRAIKTQVDRTVAALRTRYWLPSAPSPADSVTRVVAQDRILVAREVVDLTLGAYRASRDAGAARNYREAKSKAAEAEKLADRAELEGSRFDTNRFGLDPLSKAREVSRTIRQQTPRIRAQAERAETAKPRKK
jgi:hypothetical protein